MYHNESGKYIIIIMIQKIVYIRKIETLCHVLCDLKAVTSQEMFHTIQKLFLN